MLKLYFDVCCLNRPFDDQSQPRIRIESEAVLTLMERAEVLRWRIYGSEVIDFEVAAISDTERRTKVTHLGRIALEQIGVDTWIERRAEGLNRRGFAAIDALHLACAERRNVDIVLTTDDHFIRQAEGCVNQLKTRVVNPAAWWMEQKAQ